MRVSITYDLRNPPQWRQPFPQFYRDSIDHMCYMEELGFDGIWVQQHHFEESAYGPSFPAFAGVLAARTHRVRIGPHIKILPLYHPLLVAEEMAFLDNLLEGRLEVGLGIGHRLPEFQALGISHKHRPSRMEEGVEIMRLAWSQDKFSYHGRRFSFEDIEVQPKPIQKPHPPLWVATRTVAASQRAARLRCHLLPGTNLPEVHQAYCDTLKELGEDPADYHVASGLTITVTDEDPQKVWERYRPYALYRGKFYDEVVEQIGDPPMSSGMPGMQQAGPDKYRNQYIIGDADAVLETLTTLRGSWSWDGLKQDEVIVRAPLPGTSIKESIPSYERFARDIMPVLKSW